MSRAAERLDPDRRQRGARGDDSCLLSLLASYVLNIYIHPFACSQVFIADIRAEITKELLPLIEAMHPLVLSCPCPPIILAYNRMLRELTRLCPCNSSWILLGSVCEIALADAFAIKERGHSDVSVHTPCSPLLWKESLRELLPMLLLYRLKLLPGIHNKGESANEFSIDGSQGGRSPPSTIPLSVLLALLWHPVSDVREGVLSGCSRALEKCPTSSVILLDHGLLGSLMRRIGEEKQPSLLQKAMRLLCT